MSERFDVVVIGAGHAGCEAAAAAVRLGARTVLVTADAAATARMSCNPAVGGIAKGHLVREIDALGGLMARVTDRAGIQFKVLNRGRGPAVWSPRVQCDKARYAEAMSDALAAVGGLTRRAGVAARVRLERGRVAGVQLEGGETIDARAVVITPGTFLNGVMHVGERQAPGGRTGEHAAAALSECLQALGLARARLKTGTPPRLHRDAIDFAAMAPQPGDDPPQAMSHWSDPPARAQAMCWLTHTCERTHAIIRAHLHRSPMATGAITGRGPRYCPSLEDKVTRFADKSAHALFIEPEGTDVPEIYVNGFSTSLPAEIQLAAIRTVPGLEHADMIRPGYAVEYDVVLPHQLDGTLQVRAIPGLWLAGQICGTSGYEEAAAQGLMAGINAALAVSGRAPFVLRRDEAYIGVLIDDLVTREHHEPYRMFTSAAEHRLLLRADNADERLCARAATLGLISEVQAAQVRAKYEAIAAEERRLARARVRVRAECGDATRSCGVRSKSSGAMEALSWLTQPGTSYAALEGIGVTPALPPAWGEALEVRARYRGYIARQQRVADRTAALEMLALPRSLWAAPLVGLSREAQEKLERRQPATLGQAGRIAGVSPADVAVLLVHARRAGAQLPAR